MEYVTKEIMELIVKEIIDAVKTLRDEDMSIDKVKEILESNGIVEVIEKVNVYVKCRYYGDFVRCMDCGKLMLIELGGTACKECKSENLKWYDEDKPEWTIEELEKNGFEVIKK